MNDNFAPEGAVCAPQSRWRPWAAAGAAPLAIRRSEGLVPYPEALAQMEAKVEAIRAGAADELWLLEHPPLYTAGTSAKTDDLLAPISAAMCTTWKNG